MLKFIQKLLKPEIRDRSIDLKFMTQSGALFLDVRRPEEFAEGHIEGAKNIPVEILEQQLDKVKKYNKAILAYCRSGRRSGRATEMLRAAGIEVYNAGGFENLKKRLQRKA